MLGCSSSPSPIRINFSIPWGSSKTGKELSIERLRGVDRMISNTYVASTVGNSPFGLLYFKINALVLWIHIRQGKETKNHMFLISWRPWRQAEKGNNTGKHEAIPRICQQEPRNEENIQRETVPRKTVISALLESFSSSFLPLKLTLNHANKNYSANASHKSVTAN